jgi:hypothetical protein
MRFSSLKKLIQESIPIDRRIKTVGFTLQLNLQLSSIDTKECFQERRYSLSSVVPVEVEFMAALM